jgi:excisionase family DNA binding protein
MSEKPDRVAGRREVPIVAGEMQHLHQLAERFGIPIERFVDRIGLRPREIAQTLGVAPRTVENWIESGRLRAVKVGRIVIVPTVALFEFLDRHEHRRETRVRSVRAKALALLGEASGG